MNYIIGAFPLRKLCPQILIEDNDYVNYCNVSDVDICMGCYWQVLSLVLFQLCVQFFCLLGAPFR